MMDSPLEYGNVFPTPNTVIKGRLRGTERRKEDYEKEKFVVGARVVEPYGMP